MIRKFRKIIQYTVLGTLGVAMSCCAMPRARVVDATSVRIAQLRIKPEQLEAFLAAVREGMEAALRTEPGVIAIYSVADRDDPTKLTFFEIYADDEAYESHRRTPHFQKYFHTTKDMIAERILLEAVPVEMRDKHNTPLKL